MLKMIKFFSTARLNISVTTDLGKGGQGDKPLFPVLKREVLRVKFKLIDTKKESKQYY